MNNINEDKIKECVKKIFKYIINFGLLGMIIGFIYHVGCNVNKLDYAVSRIDKIETNIDNLPKMINEKLSEKNGIKDDIDKINKDINTIKENIANISNSVSEHEGILKVLSNKKVKTVKMLDEYAISTIFVSNEPFLAEPLWTSGETVIAESLNGKKKYTSKNLKETPILVPYTENGNEVYFLGQYNENNHWNGKCVLNIYNEDKLITILEAVYDDGNLLNYKRISSEKNKDGEDIWVVTNRVHKVKYNSGRTWIYRKTKNHKKKFTMKNVAKKDIVYTDDLVKALNEKLESYYKGRTADGYYNDNTGNAYLVKYDEKGNVKHLYVGKTKNGKEHDKTGNAWSISWNDTVKEYYYYKGSFSKGKRDYEPENWQPMTKKEINQIVNPDKFDCSLKRLIADKQT